MGYQFGTTAAFYAAFKNRRITINDSYVTGVSITHGNPRQHVWTYAAGRNEGNEYYDSNWQQFCTCEQIRDNFVIPDYVGTYWYCESGNNNVNGQVPLTGMNLFYKDPLWDGKGCRTPNTCCRYDGPVYFTRMVCEPANDPIEVRICNYYTSQYSDVLISHLELYAK